MTIPATFRERIDGMCPCVWVPPRNPERLYRCRYSCGCAADEPVPGRDCDWPGHALAGEVDEEVGKWKAADKELSDAYLRVRELVGAWNTKPGGVDRFEVTEAAIRKVQSDLAQVTRERDLAIAEVQSIQRSCVARTRERDEAREAIKWHHDRTMRADGYCQDCANAIQKVP